MGLSSFFPNPDSTIVTICSNSIPTANPPMNRRLLYFYMCIYHRYLTQTKSYCAWELISFSKLARRGPGDTVFFFKRVLQLCGHMANPLELGYGLHYSPSWCSGTCFSLLITKWAMWGTVTRCPLGRRENKHMGTSVCISRGIYVRKWDEWLGWRALNKQTVYWETVCNYENVWTWNNNK